ncbi:MAG TPA: IS21-like element helper ATPase IstB [Acidimicrobiales bacterium]|nr:MAG: AAA family ATPase [Actinobacteria bacterium 21-64-8]HQU00611.1 IS21-like element helper ATPase IstB [Acidimicrobiales bacterium]
MSRDAALASLALSTRSLRLPTVKRLSEPLADEAARRHQSHLDYLASVLVAEVDDRDERRRLRRVKAAGFPRTKLLSEFDLDVASGVAPATLANLASGGYLERAEPVVVLGDSGTGKSHLLIGLGMAACEQGRSVRYVTVAQLVNELAEAADEKRLTKLITRYGRVDLLLLDELGYVKLDTRGAELLFQILTEREEKSSIATASNLPFSEWGKVITDARLVAAIIDRLTFNAHIIETGTESYRLKSTRAKRTSKN